MIDPKQLFPIQALQGKSPDLTSYYAPLGDYVGGVIGTIVGVITLLVVLFTWRADIYKGRREKIFQCVFELLQAHDILVKGISRLGYKPETDPFGGVIHEFYQIYKVLSEIQSDTVILAIPQRIGIAYIYTYYGPYSEALELSTAYYGSVIAKSLHDAVQDKRNNNGTKGYLAGHQQDLSHYFRNLYTLYRYIKESRLSNADKKLLARIARSRISNYEQALLMLNIISPLGKAWTDSGIIREFEPISNVPRYFFSFEPGFNPADLFPYVHYEWKDYYPAKQGLVRSFLQSVLSWRTRLCRCVRLSGMRQRRVSRK